MRWFPFGAYVASIVLANLLLASFGTLPVGFGLQAPAGVYAAGFVFTFRNLTQQALGRRWGFAAILVGSLISWIMSANVSLGGPLSLPLASAAAFLIGETLDYAVWTPLRAHGWWIRAMAASDIVGQVWDSLVFLLLAFGSADLLLGQVVGKWWCTWVTVALMFGLPPLVNRLGRRIGWASPVAA